MIQVQMLTMGDENQEWLKLCLDGVKSPLVTLHEGPGLLGNINAARMAVWDRCGGELLSFVDPDDIPDVNAWAKIQAVFDSDPKAIAVYTLETQINEKGIPSIYQSKNGIINKTVLRTSAHHIFAFRRELYDFCRPLIQLYTTNAEWILAIAAFDIGKLVCIPEHLYQWRIHKTNQHLTAPIPTDSKEYRDAIRNHPDFKRLKQKYT